MFQKLKTQKSETLAINQTNFNANDTEIAENLISNIQEVKEDIVEFDSLKSKNHESEILGELLSYLRKNKYMSLLMICRQIEKINIKDYFAEIELNENSENLLSNEGYTQILKEFFQTKNLDIKYTKKSIEKSNAEKLNTLLGGRLEIIRKN